MYRVCTSFYQLLNSVIFIYEHQLIIDFFFASYMCIRYGLNLTVKAKTPQVISYICFFLHPIIHHFSLELLLMMSSGFLPLKDIISLLPPGFSCIIHPNDSSFCYPLLNLLILLLNVTFFPPHTLIFQAPTSY